MPGINIAEPAPMRVLTFTSLFPSAARPRHGIFVETRLRHLVDDCAVDARVVAPVPWFPFRSPRFGRYAEYATTPQRETRASGLRVTYPRYLMLPRLGVPFQPESMASAARADVAALKRGGWAPEIIDAHYLYPDGVAAALLAHELGIPFVVTARGSDVNVLARTPGPAARILRTAGLASTVIAVSWPLKKALVELGVAETKIVVLRNGVDLEVFRLEDKEAARRRLGFGPERLAICVGNLQPEKGHDLAIESLRNLPGFRLVIAGEGPLQTALTTLARRLGVAGRVSFMPTVTQDQLRHLYCSADVMLLTSTREGWPNVVLESLACGTPVVAVDVGAVREMLSRADFGRVVTSRDPVLFAKAVRRTADAPERREQLRLHAAGFDWTSISRGQFDVMARVLGRAPHAVAGANDGAASHLPRALRPTA